MKLFGSILVNNNLQIIWKRLATALGKKSFGISQQSSTILGRNCCQLTQSSLQLLFLGEIILDGSKKIDDRRHAQNA